MNEHTCQKCHGRGVIPTRQPGEGETDYRKRCQAAGKSDLTKALELHKDTTLRASLAAAFGIAYCDEDCFQMADIALKVIEAHQSASAAPVPPAGGVEVLAHIDIFTDSKVSLTDAGLRMALAGMDDVELVDGAHVTHLTGEVDRLNAELCARAGQIGTLAGERDGLLAALESRKAKHMRSCQLAIGKSQLAKHLQSELTKARELLDRAEGVEGVTRYSQLRKDIQTYLARQAPPAVSHKTMREEVGVSVEDRPALKAWLETKEAAPAARGSRETVDLNLREPSFYRNKDND